MNMEIEATIAGQVAGHLSVMISFRLRAAGPWLPGQIVNAPGHPGKYFGPGIKRMHLAQLQFRAAGDHRRISAAWILAAYSGSSPARLNRHQGPGWALFHKSQVQAAFGLG